MVSPYMIKYGGILAAIIATVLYIAYLLTSIGSLETKVEHTEHKLTRLMFEKDRLKDAITERNKYIDKLKIDSDRVEKELTKWQNQPAKVKYKTITKIRDVKSDECKQIKTVINDIRNIDYNNL